MQFIKKKCKNCKSCLQTWAVCF